ncbi:MAG: insulinase family protein, partial [Gammaproteobacteria bacterium]|nr:insulinase family protein [Gammaproteobacteria bacterium]
MNNLTTLNNGITVITHHNPDLLTASIGVWLSNGTRYESDNEHGYAHFLEHLVFKQTRSHTGHQLSSRFEVMGGHVNAETGREITAFHGLVPHHHTINLLSLLIEMLFDSDFNQDDFETERDVVLQELAMLGDDPEEALEDFGTEQVWFNDNIGRQILGSGQSLQGASSRIMHDYLLQISGNSQLCVVATGNINHEEICNICDGISKPVTPPSSDHPAPEYTQTTKHLDISTEQKHLLWIMPAVAYNDRLQPAFEIANHILVGGYDSRLYQVLREQMG